MFDRAIDSKLRKCDVVTVKIDELVRGGRVRSRGIVIQQKTGWPVQFKLWNAGSQSLHPPANRQQGGFVSDREIPVEIVVDNDGVARTTNLQLVTDLRPRCGSAPPARRVDNNLPALRVVIT